MMWTDKAFKIWMGHAGEDTQGFITDDTTVDVRSFERTQVLAITRRDIAVAEASARSRTKAQASEPERIAA